MKTLHIFKQTFLKSLIKAGCLCVVTASLVACGGSSKSNSEPSNDPTTPGSGNNTPENPDTNDTVSATTEEIQRTAARSVSSGMSINLDALKELSGEAMTGVQPDSIGANLVGDLNLDSLSQLDTTNSNFMNNSLGLDDANARVTREGNVVTIDPDETRLCAAEFPLLDLAGMTLTNCEQLMSDMRVEIQATNDESGVITYSLQNDQIIIINYAADSMAYELRLAPLQQLAQRTDELAGSIADTSRLVDGALRLSAVVTNDEPGAVAGELSLEVTEALSLRHTDVVEESMTLAPSTVFNITLNEATGDVTTSVDWGALQLIADTSDFEDGTSMSEVSLAGLTAAATFNTNSSLLALTNVGIKDTPLRININQVNVLQLNLSTFDVTIDPEQNQMTFDGALGALFTMNNLMDSAPDLPTDTQVSLTIDAAAGTTLKTLGDDSGQVLNNGPFGIAASVVSSSSGVSLEQSTSFSQGECFTSDQTVDVGLGVNLVAIACP
ncbi:MAG: hypothetical protein AB8B84_12745 [Granulosicoccus sp.]